MYNGSIVVAWEADREGWVSDDHLDSFRDGNGS